MHVSSKLGAVKHLFFGLCLAIGICALLNVSVTPARAQAAAGQLGPGVRWHQR